MKEIAERVGVDKSTVSLALSNHPRISDRTKERVRAVAAELGYRPDPALRALQAHRWTRPKESTQQVIAEIVDKGSPRGFAHKRAEEVCHERGYRLETFSLADTPAREIQKVLLARGVRGLYIASLRHDYPSDLFDWDQFCAVASGDGFSHFPVHSVQCNVFNAFRLCYQKIREAGYERIGQATFWHSASVDNDWLRLGAAKVNEDELNPDQRIPILRCSTRDQITFIRWFEKYRPDAILAFHLGAYKWLINAGFKVPGDVALACQLRGEWADLAGTDPDQASAAEAAMKQIDLMLRNNETGIPTHRQTIMVDPVWYPGDSLPPANS